MSGSPRSREGLFYLLFAVSVLLHLGLVLSVSVLQPAGTNQDVNVYLEQAMNLWREGLFDTYVTTRQYPYGYPLVLAPTFALASNAARFVTTYSMHVLLFALASLTLLPMLRASLGRNSAWLAVSAAQFLFGATSFSLSAQSEALFNPLIVAVTGVCWWAFHKPSGRRFLLLGFLAAYCAATRRIGVVVPIALLMVLAYDLWTVPRELRRAQLKCGLWALVGIGIGFFPDYLALWFRGDALRSYPDYVDSYTETGIRSIVSLSHGWITLQTTARQLAYLALMTFAAPAVLLAFLASRSETCRSRELLPLRRTAVLVGLIALGTAALTTLHIVRHVFNKSLASGYSVYPRYLDTLELPLIAVAVAAAVWLKRDSSGSGGRWRSVLPWFAAMVLLGALAGPWYRTRVGRLPSAAALEQWGLGPISLSFLALILLVVTLLALGWWRSGRYGTAATVVVAVLFSWGLSLYTPISWVTRGFHGHPPARILSHERVNAVPDAPLCVPVGHRGSRMYYDLAFRSNHPVFFVRPAHVLRCAKQHPDGWVIAAKRDRWRPPARPKAEASDRRWYGWRAASLTAK